MPCYELSKRPSYVMAIIDQHHTNVSKQTLDGVDVGLPKWHLCGHGFIHYIFGISNVKVHVRRLTVEML